MQKVGDTGRLNMIYILERPPFQLHGMGAGREKDQKEAKQLGKDYGVQAGDERSTKEETLKLEKRQWIQGETQRGYE